MKYSFFVLAAVFSLSFAGCERRVRHEAIPPPSLAPTNAAIQVTVTNQVRVITVEEATAIAEREARRRGRDRMRVMSQRFHRNEWVIGLEFEPYDQVGNHCWVYVTTNGAIKWYIRGR
ncbi:MAG TPA: hypothetical protein VI136_05510 [Verrucomicrobiae bacterium]